MAGRVAWNGRESLEVRQSPALSEGRTMIPLIEGGEGCHGPTPVGDDKPFARGGLSNPLPRLDVQISNGYVPHVHNVSLPGLGSKARPRTPALRPTGALAREGVDAALGLLEA